MGTVGVQSSLEMQVLLLSAWLGSALCLPQAAHVSPQAPDLSAHPNPAHTFVAASNRAPIQTQPTLLYGQTAPASREPSLAPLVTKFVRSITRRPAALEERREALMALDRTPTPDKPTPTIIMEMLELTLGQLTPMFPSSTLLILSLQLILAMLSSLTNRNKAVCMLKKKKKKKKSVLRQKKKKKKKKKS